MFQKKIANTFVTFFGNAFITFQSPLTSKLRSVVDVQVVLLVFLVDVQVQGVLRQLLVGDLVRDHEAELRRDAQFAQVETGVHDIGDHARFWWKEDHVRMGEIIDGANECDSFAIAAGYKLG